MKRTVLHPKRSFLYFLSEETWQYSICSLCWHSEAPGVWISVSRIWMTPRVCSSVPRILSDCTGLGTQLAPTLLGALYSLYPGNNFKTLKTQFLQTLEDRRAPLHPSCHSSPFLYRTYLIRLKAATTPFLTDPFHGPTILRSVTKPNRKFQRAWPLPFQALMDKFSLNYFFLHYI